MSSFGPDGLNQVSRKCSRCSWRWARGGDPPAPIRGWTEGPGSQGITTASPWTVQVRGLQVLYMLLCPGRLQEVYLRVNGAKSLLHASCHGMGWGAALSTRRFAHQEFAHHYLRNRHTGQVGLSLLCAKLHPSTKAQGIRP